MDGQLSRKKVIGSPIYEESLERIFVEGIERFGIFQARKYLEHILNTVEKLENDYPYYPESLRKVPESHSAKRSLMSESLFFLFQSFFRLFFSYSLLSATPSCDPQQLHIYSNPHGLLL